MDRDETGHTASLRELVPFQMARCFGRNHEHIDFRWWDNLLKVDREPMREREIRSRTQVGSDIVPINSGRQLVRNEHHDDLSDQRRIGCVDYFKARGLGFLALESVRL